MFATHAGRVPAEADLVCYWFEKAGQQIAAGKATRARECVATLERGTILLSAVVLLWFYGAGPGHPTAGIHPEVRLD